MEMILKQNENQTQTEALVEALKNVNEIFDSGEKEIIVKDSTGKVITKIINEE